MLAPPAADIGDGHTLVLTRLSAGVKVEVVRFELRDGRIVWSSRAAQDKEKARV